jgi:hypothetical protein
MRSLSFLMHALPLPRGRILRCPNVSTHVARSERFHVERNVEQDVDLNVDCDEHRRVDPEVDIHVTNAKHDCALNVASPLPLPFTNLLTHSLTGL